MSNSKSYFIEFAPCEGAAHAGDNKVITLLGIGTIKSIAAVDAVEHSLTLKDVLDAPDIMYNLIFISQARKHGFWVRIDEDPGDVRKERMDVILIGSDVVNIYGLEIHESYMRKTPIYVQS